LSFFEWDKNHDGIVTKKEIKEMTFIDPGTESSFNLLSDKSFVEIMILADNNKDAKLTIPEWIVHTFIAEHVYITPAM